jgi:hypothetical protein
MRSPSVLRTVITRHFKTRPRRSRCPRRRRAPGQEPWSSTSTTQSGGSSETTASKASRLPKETPSARPILLGNAWLSIRDGVELCLAECLAGQGHHCRQACLGQVTMATYDNCMVITIFLLFLKRHLGYSRSAEYWTTDTRDVSVCLGQSWNLAHAVSVRIERRVVSTLFRTFDLGCDLGRLLG